MFIWFYSLEGLSYTKNRWQFERIGEKLLIAPREEDIRAYLEKGEVFNVLAPYLPPPEFANLFVVDYVDMRQGVYITTQEEEYLAQFEDEDEKRRAEAKILEQRLGLRVHKSSIKLSDLGGMRNLKEYVRLVLATQNDPKLKVKGIFLVGVPGTGKSYSALAFAGETGRLLIELNLTKILETQTPSMTLHYAMQYIEKIKKPCVIWIDEIDKVFGVRGSMEYRLLGQLLTIMNDLNLETGYKIDGIFWVTANNIRQIMQNNPEFLRKGRFDVLFFVDVPRHNEAEELFVLYARKYSLKIHTRKGEELLDGELGKKLVDLSNQVWHVQTAVLGAEAGDAFVYTPAEIHQIVKELARIQALKNEVSLDDVEEVLKGMVPITVSMSDAISEMRSLKNVLTPV